MNKPNQKQKQASNSNPRKRRSSSGNGSGNGSGSGSASGKAALNHHKRDKDASLLLRLSEACNKHKSKHEKRQQQLQQELKLKLQESKGGGECQEEHGGHEQGGHGQGGQGPRSGQGNGHGRRRRRDLVDDSHDDDNEHENENENSIVVIDRGGGRGEGGDDTTSTTASANNDADADADIVAAASEETYHECKKELQVLKGAIPKVEAAYRLPYRRQNRNGNGNGIVGGMSKNENVNTGKRKRGRKSGDGIYNSSSSSSSGVGNTNTIHARDISNLCMFYHNIVMGTFCPHSRQILLQNGQNGIEIFPRIHEIFRYLASTQIIKHTISSLSSQYQQLHHQQQKEQEQKEKEERQRQHNHNSSQQDQEEDNDNDNDNDNDHDNYHDEDREQEQKRRAKSSSGNKTKILIADQICFTACILLHSIPTNLYHQSDLYSSTLSSSQSSSYPASTTTPQPMSQQYHHQEDSYQQRQKLLEQQQQQQRQRREQEERQRDTTMLIIKDIITLLFDLSSIASSNVLPTTYTADGAGGGGENGGNGDELPIIELLVLTEVLSSLSSSTTTTNGEEYALAPDAAPANANAANEDVNKNINKDTKTNNATSTQECIVEIAAMDELLSLQSGVFHLLFKFLVLKYTRRQTDDSIFEELMSLSSSSPLPSPPSSRSSQSVSAAVVSDHHNDNNDGAKAGIDSDDDHDMAGTSTVEKDDDNQVKRTYETAIEDSIYVAPFLVQHDLRSLLLACIRQVMEAEVLMGDGNSGNLNHRQDRTAGVTVPTLSTMLLSLRNKVLASNLLLLILPDLSSLANEEGDMMTINPPLWFEIVSLIANSIHVHFQFMANTLFPLIARMEHPQSDTTAPLLSTSQKKLLHPICELNKSLASTLSSLVKNVFICPLTAFNPTPYTMWSLRSKVICTFFDCTHHIDTLMNGAYHSTSSLYMSPLSSLLSESVNGLSMITLHAIQITFFPDVMVTDKDHKTDDDFSEACCEIADETKKNTEDQHYEREFEMVKLMIRDHCTVHNIYPILFNLLRNSSTTTLMISIISCLTESSASSYNDTRSVPTKQVQLLSHACEVLLRRENKRENCGSAIASAKRRRVEKGRSTNNVLDEIAIDLDCVDDSSFLLALTSFLDRVVQDAKQVIEATKNHSVHDCHASHVSTIEGASIVSSIRLIHCFVDLDSCHGNNEPVRPPETINSILSTLYQAGISLSNFIGTSSISERLSVDSVKHVSSLLDIALGVLAYSPIILDSTKVDIRAEKLRIKLSSSLANTAMMCWSNSSKLHESKIECNESNDDDFVEDFDPTVLQLLHNEHIQQLEDLFVKSRRGCHGVCKRMQSSFGMSSKKRKRCMCGFIPSASSSRIFRNYCVGMLIEENCSLQQRCILTASFHPNLLNKETDNQNQQTLSSFRDILSVPNSVLSQKLPYFTCLPNLLLSLTYKKIAASPNVSAESLLVYFTSFLKDIEYLNIFDSLLDEIGQSEIGWRSRVILGKQALECFRKIIFVYDYIVQLINCVSNEDKGDSEILMKRLRLSICNEPLSQISSICCMEKKREDKYLSSEISWQNSLNEDPSVYFQNLIVGILKRINSIADESIDTSVFRRAKWDCVRAACLCLPTPKLRQFVSCTLPASQGESHLTDSDGTKPVPLLKWLLHTTFVDSNNNVRFHCASMLGSLLLSNNCKVLCALYGHNPDDFDHYELVEKLYNDVDELLARHCGVMQSALTSLTMRATYGTCTNTSTWSTESEDVTAICSRQISSIFAISSLCRCVKGSSNIGKAVIEKGIMRLVRMWTVLPEGNNDFSDNSNSCNHETVSAIAFKELIELHRHGIFCQNIVERSGDSFLPALFSDLLSRGIIQQRVYGKNNCSGFEDYETIIQLLQRFFLRVTTQNIFHEEYEKIDATVKYVRSILPSLLTGLILGQDFESLCACTGFHMYLISEQNRLSWAVHQPHSKEKVIGMFSKTRSSQRKKAPSASEVKRQTLALCGDDQGAKILGKEILGKVLPILLMETDKSPLLFYLKTILESRKSLGELILFKEGKIIEDMLWELAESESETDNDNFQISAKSWLDSKSNICAVQGLKKGAIIMKQVNEKVVSADSKQNGMFQLASLDILMEGSKEVEKWVHKHFMKLLVTCVTIRWKRGKIDTKIRAVKCLRVLVRFLRVVDAPQYITQVLTMIDSVMSFKCDAPDSSLAKSKLQLLAVKTLAHFVHILLAGKIETVGENLCKIIVSLFPLFEKEPEDSSENKLSDQYRGIAITQAINMMEWLSEGESGRQLAPYFNDIPFLPKHPHLQHVREALKRNGVDCDHLLFIDSQLSCESTVGGRETPSSASSSSINEKLANHNAVMQVALRRRLHCLKRLFNHENDNVRRIVLEHLITLIRNNQDLFYNLVKTENASLRFLTIQTDNGPALDSGLSGGDSFNGESMKSFIDGILHRCVTETNMEIRLILATCLGEIGAINPEYIGYDSNFRLHGTSLSNRWMFENGAPWKLKSVKVHCALQLLTKHFVAALKAAPTTTDQHKIAFAIQEVLKMLDASAPSSSNTDEENKNKEMNPWLRDKLVEAEVLNIIEPFWSSLYKQTEAMKPMSPPFFEGSTSYFTWLSAWARYMVETSDSNEKSRYSDLFFTCRSAVRSEAGIRIMEFLLPLLVLDTICFGDDVVRNATIMEMNQVLSSCSDSGKNMEKMELQKSVAAVFMVIETFQSWADTETEERFSSQRVGKSHTVKHSRNSNEGEKSNWPADASIMLIEEMLKAIPLSQCAKAATFVGMHSQALRFLEMEVRKKCVEGHYEAAISNDIDGKYNLNTSVNHSLSLSYEEGMDLGLFHYLLGELNDFDSMNAVSKLRKKQVIMEDIREKEADGDWDGVLKLCEQASQIQWFQREQTTDLFSCLGTSNIMASTEKDHLSTAYLKALLELGLLDSVLNRVRGLLPSSQETSTATLQLNDDSVSLDLLLPYAVQASWRLSRWDDLDQLLTHEKKGQEIDLEGQYNIALGKAMLALHRKKPSEVKAALLTAREAIIPSLSVAARENYDRTYPYFLKLHCLREVEDSCNVLCLPDGSDETHIEFASFTDTDWGWEARLDTVGTNISASTNIIQTRLALARMSSNTTTEIEASLWLEAGKKARKSGLYDVAETYLSHADASFQRLQTHSTEGSSLANCLDINASEVRLQLAKIKHAMGKSTEALLMVKQKDFDALLVSKSTELMEKVVGNMKEDGRPNNFVRIALQATEWMVESGLKSGSEVIARYKLLNKMLPKWERAHYNFAKYLNSVLDSRVNALASQMNGNIDDDSVRANLIQMDSLSQKYILNSMNQYSQALSLSQKHVFQALPRLLTLWFEFTAIDTTDQISNNQDQANQSMVEFVKAIPAIAYYSVLPQLISRIGHPDPDTVTIVTAILKRVLLKFPAQAMWHLAWLRHSVHKDRRQKGDDIFKVAQKSLHRNEDMKMHDLLEASKGLFKFLIDLAKYQPKKEDKTFCNVHVWKGNVDLKEFMPPVQAALTVSRNAVGKGGSREAFPKCVPRMRAFSTQVQLMSSKARPKKLTAFAIHEGSRNPEPIPRHTNKPCPGDIGEMHFLVKREARGDLRKDARVQDFNNVINRLLSSSVSDKNVGKRQHRRLYLRTYSVTCLSEDCGILEWVPQTNSLRNLIGSSYHPYASHHSVRRRAKRMTDFADAKLRSGFLKCQDQYVKHGNLTKATQLFSEEFLKEYPPLFYWWFLHQFQDPHKWFEARSHFALSSAVWSAVGHVIGLGDRHSENILVDTSNGDCVHVDFDCIFDKGLHLPRPEVVPFRLTPNMVDAFGPTGAEGAFAGGLSASMKTLRDNRDILLSVLEPFLKDPVIDWKRQRQKQGTTEPPRESVEARRSIRVIEQRLKGMYNLRNPNCRKIRRVDGHTVDEDDEMARLIPLSVEGQVHKMITEASSHENLVQLYVGWMPWL